MKKTFLQSLSVAFVCSAFTVGAMADPVIGQPAPTFEGMATDGTTISLEDLKGKPVMLEWTNHGCPYVQKHYDGGNMQKTQRALTEDGVVWLSIISSAPGTQGYVSPEEADELTASRGAYPSHVILDPEGKIGRLYDAKTTPHMFLIDASGTLEYMGAIDDKPSARPSSLEGAHNYALAAWEEVKAGEAVSENNTKPYGCTVKYGDAH
ncbi:redoxin domain-containing protein [Kordiimonas sp.]|uniref:redoxin domain-containing protein n=1 Tax=Kordiimonas sp. TaxID=1970157 RepID=UPI003A90C070